MNKYKFYALPGKLQRNIREWRKTKVKEPIDEHYFLSSPELTMLEWLEWCEFEMIILSEETRKELLPYILAKNEE
jgi:hypothetical protein